MKVMWLRKINEVLKLYSIRLGVLKFNTFEYIKVLYLYYRWPKFAVADLLLLAQYLFRNPFRISRRFLERKGEQDIYTYGETPLTTLAQISKQCELKPSDTIYELGCGRGRSCFWLSLVLGARVTGLEWTPAFVRASNRVVKLLSLSNLDFNCKNFFKTDFTDATVIYLYGTCLPTAEIICLIERLKSLAPGTKIITVSYPLTAYCESNEFELMKSFNAEFTWGEAEVYLHLRKD